MGAADAGSVSSYHGQADCSSAQPACKHCTTNFLQLMYHCALMGRKRWC